MDKEPIDQTTRHVYRSSGVTITQVKPGCRILDPGQGRPTPWQKREPGSSFHFWGYRPRPQGGAGFAPCTPKSARLRHWSWGGIRGSGFCSRSMSPGRGIFATTGLNDVCAAQVVWGRCSLGRP